MLELMLGLFKSKERQKPKDAEYKKNKREFLKSVFKPDEFQRHCDNIDRIGNWELSQKAEDWVGYWINELKGDTKTMGRIIDTYKDGKHLGGYVLAKAIRAIEGKDSKYFEALHAHLSGLENPEGFSGGYVPNIAQELHDVKDKDPNAEFKLAALRNWHAKHAAIARVTNQEYLKKVVEQYRKKGDLGFENDGAAAIANIEDQAYLAEVAQDGESDNFMREAAIRRLTDSAVLEQFAQLSDRVTDQSRYQGDAAKQREAYNLYMLRCAARERLIELKEKK